MSRIVDNLIAYKVIHKLLTPFAATDAYKFGIIDAHGNILKKYNNLTTTAEKDAYTYLDRLVFNMKRILNKIPNAEHNLKGMTAAMWLVKECYENKIRTTSLMEARFNKIMEHMNNGVVLVEEEILVSKVLSEEGVGAAGLSAAPANVTGSSVSTDVPKLLANKTKKYKAINRRSAPVETKPYTCGS
jgi:hypothetical protein